TSRAILLSPSTFLLGRYATWILPKNGRRWCSHRLKNSMSFTTTISSYFTSNKAPLTILWTSIRYPLVRNRSALSTRSGVRTNPPRWGSSPNRSKTSLMSGAMLCSSGFGCITLMTALFDFIGPDFKYVPRRLGNADLLQLRPLARKDLFPMRLQTAANLDPQVFRGRHQPLERLHFGVQIAVLEPVEHLPRHHLIEQCGVHRAPRRAIQRPARAHLQHVVVAVPVRMIAFPVQPAVLFLAQLRHMQPVRSCEFVPPRHAEHVWSPK